MNPKRILEARKGVRFEDATLRQVKHVAESLRRLPIVLYDLGTGEPEHQGEGESLSAYISRVFQQRRTEREEEVEVFAAMIEIDPTYYRRCERGDLSLKTSGVTRVTLPLGLKVEYFGE